LNKVKSIEELSTITIRLRGMKKKIVHCHGIFDLLHIGHIRYFKQASRLGDILIITVTSDKFVNKGPHRPVFNQDLRAEAIAALDCVDYVAINKWPTAVKTIQMLKPNFYVKGNEYEDKSKDYTRGIGLEEAAIRSVGGKIIFTNDITFSSSNLINRYFSSLPRKTQNYLSDFSNRYKAKDIITYLKNAQSLKVLVVGEAIIDEYQYCQAIGKSCKEPMLVVKHLSTEQFLGGILAVANHLANFCGSVNLVTCLGSENSQEDLIRQKLNPKIKKTFLYRANSPTIIKRRFIDSYFFTKLLGVYEMDDQQLDKDDNTKLCEMLNDLVPKYDLVIVVDFGHGMLTEKTIGLLCDKSHFLALNAQFNAGNLGYHTISRYHHADYVCMAENEIKIEQRDQWGDMRKMILGLSRKLNCEKIVVTRGNHGCFCYDQEKFIEVPSFAHQVVDRMGAGDTFLSLTALCMFQNVPMEIVGFIGNVVGAEAVATVGHRKSIDQISLFKHIKSLLK